MAGRAGHAVRLGEALAGLQNFCEGRNIDLRGHAMQCRLPGLRHKPKGRGAAFRQLGMVEATKLSSGTVRGFGRQSVRHFDPPSPSHWARDQETDQRSHCWPYHSKVAPPAYSGRTSLLARQAWTLEAIPSTG